MQNRCKNYNGVIRSNLNPYEDGRLLLSTNEEVSFHKTACNETQEKTMHKTSVITCNSSNSRVSDDRFKKWENQVLTFGEAFCDNQECNFVGMKVSDLEDHIKLCNGVPNFSIFCCIHCRCRFSNKEDHLKHQENCNITTRFDNSAQKRGDSLHFRVIKRMKNIDSGEDHIIQPMPDFPKGQYRRRRPYSVQHIKSWVLSLEKYKYVKCIYQNCYFIAMSLEDMVSHFGYCNGDGDFAKFVCQFCNGRVTSEDILQKHISRSHPLDAHQTVITHTAVNNHIKVEPQSEESNGGILFADMESQSMGEANTEESQELNEVTKTSQSACWRVWNCEIKEFGQAFCRKSLCNFMAPSIPLLDVHWRTCDGTPDFEFLNCPKCRYRLPTREDLMCHMSKCDNERMKYHPAQWSGVPPAEKDPLETGDDFEVGPVFRQSEGLKFYSKHRKVDSVTTPELHSEGVISYVLGPENKIDKEAESSESLYLERSSSQKKRGRPKSTAREKAENVYGNKQIEKAENVYGNKQIEKVENVYGNKQIEKAENVYGNKQIEKAENVYGNKQIVKCGKCGEFQGTRKSYDEHNLKTHVGLGWVEGETPVDVNDEKRVVRLVKEAFKLSKKGTCEKCNDVKKSVLGFVSHIQNCGKTDEEKEAMKVPCPYCDGKYLKYSVNAHIKLCRLSYEEDEVKNEVAEKIPEPSGKRRSAIKAASKFQDVLSDDDVDQSRSKGYILYEKGGGKLPELNFKLKNLWYKLANENEKIPCHFANCKTVSQSVRDARTHHFNCPFLPNKVFLCELCDFYDVNESSIQTHFSTHRKSAKRRKMSEDEEVNIKLEINDEDEDEEYGKDDDEDVDEEELEEESSDGELEESVPRSGNLKRKKSLNHGGKAKRIKVSTTGIKTDMDIENRLKQIFCRRENLENLRRTQFYTKGIDMTLEEELSKVGSSELWPELHTSSADWVQVPLQKALPAFPELSESVPIRFGESDNKWRRFERFRSDLIEGIPVLFTGGSVRSMSWCKVSFTRMLEKTHKQYLAVSTARKAEHFRDIHNKSSFRQSTLLQIWDIGVLDNALAQDIPKFSLGIVHNGGEIWDLAWFPEDTYSEGTESRLKRLGLLATASEDGCVRVWSICDPEQLKRTSGLPIYKTEPKAVLVADKDLEEGCLQLAVGPNGVLAGGFGNGSVSVWTLKNLSSPFCKNSGKFKTIRAHLVIQAHKTTITALAFCPLNSRYISTAGLDRFVKVWDAEFPYNPIEQYNKEYSLNNIWTMNWPSLIYNYDDVVLNFNKGPLKFIRDIVSDRHPSTFTMENTCLSLSYSDWLNVLCVGSITGEVKLIPLKNLMYDQKRPQKRLSSLRLEKLNDCRTKESEGLPSAKAKQTDASKNLPRTYDEVNTGFGLVFRDKVEINKGKPKKPEVQPEAFPIKAINKISFNPNFKSFTHVALGYNCGLIRIQPLKEFQSVKSIKFVIEKAQKKEF